MQGCVILTKRDIAQPFCQGTCSHPLLISTYTKLIVYFMIRLIGRLIGRIPGAPTEEIQPALRVSSVPMIAVSTAWFSIFTCPWKWNTQERVLVFISSPKSLGWDKHQKRYLCSKSGCFLAGLGQLKVYQMGLCGKMEVMTIPLSS
jgi:hypothetical protein